MNIFKLLKSAKFDYDQTKEKNVIRDSNFQFFFVSDHLNTGMHYLPEFDTHCNSNRTNL